MTIHHNEKWTLESVIRVASECSTRTEFRERFAGARKWAERKGVFEAVCRHMKQNYWTKDRAFDEASKYTSRHDMYKGSSSAYQFLTRNGLVDEAFSHTYPPVVWDFQSVKDEAKKYASREEFRQSSSGASHWAVRNGCWDEVCSHMEHLNKLVTFEEIVENAAKYTTRSDFYYLDNRCYSAALRLDILDVVCEHMTPGSTVSDNNCVYLWSPVGYEGVFKVGITSIRLMDRRIKTVSRSADLEVNYVLAAVVQKATSVERQLLNLGMPFSFGRGFRGHTEFREYSPEELIKGLDILSQYETVNLGEVSS